MKKTPKVYAHASYVGTTGYNNHTRDFFRHLQKYVDLKVRNFTIGKNWDWPNDEPHKEDYINEVDKKLLIEQTLWTGEDTRDEFPIYKEYPNDFKHNVNLVLEETNHHYFYDSYKGPKIAYNVWESTLQPEGFFNKLLEYDQLWFPSKWQAECTIKQGADPNKVKVVPEGVDTNTFYPEDPQTVLDYVDGRFKFIIFGRWDYRKSTKEIIETFLKEFKPNEPVDLIVSIDNPFSGDNFKTTEERLEHYDFTDERIKIKHFPSREDYITYMKNGHVFLSCARSEGWNLPLIEAMACGTPAIYSACCAQMEFAEGKGLPVKILGERPALDANYNHFNTVVGNYYEPDFEDLARVMRDAYENYVDHKKRALEEAKLIHRDFNWEHIGKIGAETLQDFITNSEKLEDTNTINVNYINAPKVEILGDVFKEYEVEFINRETNEVIHKATINNNMWTSCSKEYYIPWLIKINGKEHSRLELEGQRVLISLDSNSLGDTIGWTPYAIKFAKKHKCKVILSTFHNDWFKNLEAYKDIEWLEPGNSTGCTAHYKIGWFRDDNGGWQNFDMHPRQCNIIPMQATSSDILGLEEKELNYGLDFPKGKRPYKEKYIVIGPNATSGCKEWVYGNWVTLCKLLQQQGYKVISLTKGEWKLDGVINHYNQPLDVVANYLHHADLFIGLGSGLSWLNWALGKHTVMINGFSDKHHEFTSRITRIMNDDACFPCWTNRNFVFDAGDWDWCPIHKGTEKQHICQKSITPMQVFKIIKNRLTSKK
jgi:autotransporter strand-loop-strand O-heptosyltransferase|tara:strand:- start:2182 stop:4479 length:2298 start_codon:yes stop_codon:yes gene_type:complete